MGMYSNRFFAILLTFFVLNKYFAHGMRSKQECGKFYGPTKDDNIIFCQNTGGGAYTCPKGNDISKNKDAKVELTGCVPYTDVTNLKAGVVSGKTGTKEKCDAFNVIYKTFNGKETAQFTNCGTTEKTDGIVKATKAYKCDPPSQTYKTFGRCLRIAKQDIVYGVDYKFTQ